MFIILNFIILNSNISLLNLSQLAPKPKVSPKDETKKTSKSGKNSKKGKKDNKEVKEEKEENTEKKETTTYNYNPSKSSYHPILDACWRHEEK